MDSSISASAAASRTVCLTCGDKGDVKLLIYCSQCRDAAVHHYCQEKISADDDNSDWICWDCTPKVAKVEQFRKSERISERKIHAFDVRAEWRRKLYRCKVKALRLDEARHDTSGAVQSLTAHSSFHVLQKEKPSFIDTKKHKDIGEECADICYSEQQIESVKAGNTPLVGKRQDAYCSTLNNEEGGMVERDQVRGDSSVQDSKSAQSLGEIGNQQEMRKSRRKFVVLDDGSDFEGEGGAIGGNFSSSFPGEQNFPLDTLYSDPQVESANCLSAQPVIDPIWRGCFIFNTESESSINILAHLSNKACEKASMAANSLPVKLDVKLVSKNDVWPRSFLRLQPTDCSIALYLFPELEEDENSYDALLEDVIDNDLAMSATIDDLELLIFSSRVLPQKHWRSTICGACLNISHPHAQEYQLLSGIQNAATSDLPNEVEGAHTGSPQDQSFPSPLSILKDVNSGSPPGRLPSPLSSCCNSTSTKDSPCHHERVDSIKG
ncbi:hypothetical protein H5410_055291 [Solanum commersonii]|uniref:AIPP2-like SPOC-like domain-containing protein n=1 Tax=Solanum commersonii TaxID=4109 RepID=A0A9J5WI99_SOLCO|nr:hypothetical protein H5410_055291 [Solanum commersonii]